LNVCLGYLDTLDARDAAIAVGDERRAEQMQAQSEEIGWTMFLLTHPELTDA
jgi:hypothetical protein